jgi:anti-sigma-K factor RsiG
VDERGGGNRRIDRIRGEAYVAGLAELDLEELRRRRDECLAEREYLSLLRRLVQGRAEILLAELDSRATDEDTAPLIERLATILAGEEPQGGSRGEAVRMSVPEEELSLARRRVERLVADAKISDPGALDDE